MPPPNHIQALLMASRIPFSSRSLSPGKGIQIDSVFRCSTFYLMVIIAKTTIVDTGYHYYRYTPKNMHELGTMPYFESLETIGVPYLFTASSLSSLTHLDLTSEYEGERIGIEDIPKRVQSLKLNKYTIDQRPEDSMWVYQFPDLKHIDFIDVIINARAGCLLAPQLECLEVEFCFANTSREFSTHFGPHLVDGALFGSPLLCRLRLLGFAITSSSVQSLRSLSTSRELYLEYCRVSDDFVIHLFSSPGSPDALFPVLKKLSVSYWPGNESRGRFLELLKERVDNRPSLEVDFR